MSTGTTCTVLVDGVRAVDGSPGDPANAPTVLDDLTVTWGREDTMTQPAPDTCTFTVYDPTGAGFGSTYRVGHRVDVQARGDTYPAPSVTTFTNPGFETATVTWSPVGGTAARTTTRTRTGANALAVRPNTAGVPVSVLLAPAPFQPPGTNPDAWDAIPTTKTGQTWTATVSVWAPAWASVTARAALFTGPYVAAGTPAGTPQTVDGDNAWHTITAQHVVQVDDQWVGLYLTLSPTGPAWDQLPSTLTWDGFDPTLSWDDQGTLYVDDAQVTSPAAGTGRGVLVFSGRITNLSSSWQDAPTLNVTAAGFTADLDNRTVGDQPWVVESVAARTQRILTLAGLPITIDIDTSIDQTLLTWRDVDAQGATGLLQEIAESVDGVLWPAVHESLGAYLRLEDPELRTPLLQLALVDGVIVIVQGDPNIGYDLSACTLLREPAIWVQDVADVVTRVAVDWNVQGVDDKGQPKITTATEQLVDTALEVQHGTRRVQVSTQLQAAADAVEVAQRILSRTSPDGWRAEGLTIDDDDVVPGAQGVALVLDLLDGTSRIGAPIVLGDLPYWSPAGAVAGVYLEGGAYRFTGGRWVLELSVSASTGLGGSAAWDELDPTWTWNQWDPSLTWNDLRGAAAP
jgi:hypothetical protein